MYKFEQKALKIEYAILTRLSKSALGVHKSAQGFNCFEANIHSYLTQSTSLESLNLGLFSETVFTQIDWEMASQCSFYC